MNASAIYSKSGKGVQEASGKTNTLARSDRAVLAAIDGRATLADVAQKVGKNFDVSFERVIEALDKGGFIREVSPGTATPAKPGAAKPGAKPAAAPVDPASDLDFTTALSVPRGKPPPPASQTKPTHTAPVPPPPPPPTAAEKAQAAKSAAEQQDAFARAREEAERKAAAERERVKAEAEAKMRAEAETKMRAEADAKLKAQAEAKARAEAEAKIRAAQEAAERAAAEAKAKAEAEAKKAREEAERVRREAEEKAERARREAEEKMRREQEELKRKLEEERKAREEAERRAAEEAKRVEEERRKLEAERKAREEEKRREEEERTQRRIQEERERVERKRQQREEEERAEKAALRRRAQDPDAEEAPKPKPKAPEPPPLPTLPSGFSDTLLADLDSFTSRDEAEQKEREEAARKEQEAAAARAREAEARRAKEEAERKVAEEKARRKQEEAERKAREEADLREREEREKQRLKDEEAKRKKEAEEREKKAKQEEQLAATATRTAAFDAQQRSKRERDLMSRSRVGPGARAQRKGWGKPIAITLFVLLVIAAGVAHVMPIDTSEHERAASAALGRPVRIGVARLSLFAGPHVRLTEVNLGEGVSIAEARAFPELDAWLGSRKAFSRIEIDRMKLEQDALGQALFAKVKGPDFSVARVLARDIELTGPLVLPKGLEFEAVYDGEGTARLVMVRGPDALLAKLTMKGGQGEFDMSATTFSLPFAPEITIGKFQAKGTITRQGLQVTEWDGALLS